MAGLDSAIDLGTSNIRIYNKVHGIVIDEPTVIAVDKFTDKIIAIGREAYDMFGKTSSRTSVVYPLLNGVISDLYLVEQLINYLLNSISKGKIVMPRVVACIPGEITEVEKRAMINAISISGVRKICLIEKPLAAAMGAGIDIKRPHGCLVIDIGGGTTDMAIISLNGIALTRSLKIAGKNFDEDIVKHMRRNHSLIIGEHMAEKAKEIIGCVCESGQICSFKFKGRNAVTGLPQAMEITSDELMGCMSETAMKIVREVQNMLEDAPPELMADISDDGIILTGGGALMAGMDKLISKHTKLPVHVAENPQHCVVLGAGKAIDYIDDLQNKTYGVLNPLNAEY